LAFRQIFDGYLASNANVSNFFSLFATFASLIGGQKKVNASTSKILERLKGLSSYGKKLNSSNAGDIDCVYLGQYFLGSRADTKYWLKYKQFSQAKQSSQM
jgi:hypothetical protein